MGNFLKSQLDEMEKKQKDKCHLKSENENGLKTVTSYLITSLRVSPRVFKIENFSLVHHSS